MWRQNRACLRGNTQFSCFPAFMRCKTKQCCIFGCAPVGSNVGLCCHWDGTFYNVAVGPLSLIDQSHGDFMEGLTSPVKTPQSTQLFFRAMFTRPKCVQTLASFCLPDVADKSLIISHCYAKHSHLMQLITKEQVYMLCAEICVMVVRGSPKALFLLRSPVWTLRFGTQADNAGQADTTAKWANKLQHGNSHHPGRNENCQDQE